MLVQLGELLLQVNLLLPVLFQPTRQFLLLFGILHPGQHHTYEQVQHNHRAGHNKAHEKQCRREGRCARLHLILANAHLG